jgi:hypothetical protein
VAQTTFGTPAAAGWEFAHWEDWRTIRRHLTKYAESGAALS